MAGEPARNLLVTNAFDDTGERSWRTISKLFIASALRSLWDGDIYVAKNFAEPLFAVPRQGLFERHWPLVKLPPKQTPAPNRHEELRKSLRQQRFEFANTLLQRPPSNWNWIVLADADCLILRNIDHLFESEADVLISTAAGVADIGFFAIKACIFSDFFADWTNKLTKMESDGMTLGRIFEERQWRIAKFERGEIARPRDPYVDLETLGSSAVIHFSKLDMSSKLRYAFSFHMMSVYCDERGVFLDIMDS